MSTPASWRDRMAVAAVALLVISWVASGVQAITLVLSVGDGVNAIRFVLASIGYFVAVRWLLGQSQHAAYLWMKYVERQPTSTV